MKIFLTGGTGFVGSHFINIAINAGHTVTALRRPGSVPRVPLPNQPEWITGSLTEFNSNVLHEMGVVVHLAAVGVSPSHCTWEEAISVNVYNTIALLKASMDNKVPRFLLVGTSAEYGTTGEHHPAIPPDAPLQPKSLYGASKAAASIMAMTLARNSPIQMAVCRLGTVYGPGQSEANFWSQLKSAAESGGDFPMTLGTQTRDFVPVTQAAKDLLNIAVNGSLKQGQPRIFHINSGKACSLREFAVSEWKALGATGKIQFGAIPQRPDDLSQCVLMSTPWMEPI